MFKQPYISACKDGKSILSQGEVDIVEVEKSPEVLGTPPEPKRQSTSSLKSGEENQVQISETKEEEEVTTPLMLSETSHPRKLSEEMQSLIAPSKTDSTPSKTDSTPSKPESSPSKMESSPNKEPSKKGNSKKEKKEKKKSKKAEKGNNYSS